MTREVILQPGELFFGKEDVVVRTLTIPSYERGVARLLRYDRHP